MKRALPLSLLLSIGFHALALMLVLVLLREDTSDPVLFIDLTESSPGARGQRPSPARPRFVERRPTVPRRASEMTPASSREVEDERSPVWSPPAPAEPRSQPPPPVVDTRPPSVTEEPPKGASVAVRGSDDPRRRPPEPGPPSIERVEMPPAAAPRAGEGVVSPAQRPPVSLDGPAPSAPGAGGTDETVGRAAPSVSNPVRSVPGASGAGGSVAGAAGAQAPPGPRAAAGRTDGRDGSTGDGRALTALPPGGGEGSDAEYHGYLAVVRRRLQETLRYPPAARRRSLSGTVHIEILVKADGAVSEAIVVASSSHPVLDDAAIEAVRRLPRVPFPVGLPPRTLRARLPVVFELR